MPEHCVKVPIVYDWITIDEKNSKCKFIPVRQTVEEMEDCIYINFYVRKNANEYGPIYWKLHLDEI